MERKIKLLIEYEGSAYHGWQFQRNGLSIQEVLEKCKEIAKNRKNTDVIIELACSAYKKKEVSGGCG